MIEYKVRRIDGSGTGDVERACNELAREGWRLVSTAATGTDAPVLLFFERETGEQRAAQDTWRTQHGGQDAG
jgi:hypothetical protein